MITFVLGGGTFGRRPGHEHRALMNGTHGLQKRPEGACVPPFLLLLPRKDTVQHHPWLTGSASILNLLVPGSWISQPPELEVTHFSCSILGILLEQPQKADIEGKQKINKTKVLNDQQPIKGLNQASAFYMMSG